MKLIDREVCAPLSALTPRDSGALIGAQPNMEGSSRRSWRDLGEGAGWLAGGRVAAQLMRLAAAAGIAVLCGAPMASAQSLGTVALGSSSSATAVTVKVAIAGTLNSISVSTQGISSLDFSNTGGGTCAVLTTYTAGESCTVHVTFSPTAPGLRLGAVELHDSSGDLLGRGYMYGTGTGSLLRYNPGTQAVLYSSLNAPQAMVVDAGSNIYIADTQNTRVLKLPWNGTSYGTPVTVGSGWSAPSGVAVDGAGNLYVADAALGVDVGEVVEVPWTGSAYGTQVTIGSYPFAQDLTIDGSGNLYILTSATTITKLPWDGNGYGASSTLGSGLSGGKYNTDVVDSSGNIYVADYNNGNVVKETPSGPNYEQTILGNFGDGSIDGIATDPAGDVYLADYSANTVLMLPWTGSGYGASITLTSNGSLSGPEAIYLDGIGNIYIESYNSNSVEKWSVTNLPTLTFPTHTNVGSPDTTDNPQTVSLLNVGNAALTILVPGAGDNPSIASGFSYDSSSTCPQLGISSGAATLASAASCTYAVNFDPTEAGTNSGALMLTDNYLGASSATQSIGLSGTGISAVTKLAFGIAPATPIALGGNAGGSVTVDEEMTSSAIDTAATDLITLTVTGPSSYSQMYTATAVDGVATFNLSSVAISVSGSYTYTASLTSATSAVAFETVNSTTPQTISFSPSSPVAYGVAPITLSATGGASGNAVTFSITSGGSFGSLSGTNNSTLTVTGVGTITIAANQAGNTNYAAATQVTASIVVTTVAQTISFSPSSPVAYGVAPITLSATGGASGNAVTYSITSGGSFGSLSGTHNSMLTITGAGTIMIAANQAGNTNYAAATQVTASIVVTTVAQTISFSPSSPVAYGTSPITLSATGGASGNAVTFSITSGGSFGSLGGTNNSTLTVTGVGTITIAANQAGNTNYAAATQVTASIVVTNLSQTITFSPSSPVTFGVAPITLSATGGASGNAVTFGYVSGPGTLSGANSSTLTVTGAGTVVVTANQAAGTGYSAATAVTASIVVSKVSQTIAFTPLSPVTYGASPITLSATGGASGNAVTFSITSGSSFGSLSGTNNSTLTITGAGTITIAANQAGNANYAAATQVTTSVVVANLSQTITFSPSSPVTFGVAPITLSATGGASGNAVTFSIISGGSFGSLSGAHNSMLTITGAGTITITANQAGNTNYAAATQVTASIVVANLSQTITFSPSSPVTFGVAPITLSATGGASGNAVTFSITSGNSFGSLSGTNNSTLTVTGAGTITIAANQAGNTDYAAATQATASILITKAALRVVVNPASSVYGAAFPTFSGTLTGAFPADGITVSYSTKATPASPAGGNYSIVATLNDPSSKLGNYAVTNTPAALSIEKAASAVQVSSSVNPVLLSNPTTLTAIVSSAAGQPTGTITFLDNATPIGSVPLSSGVATLTLSSLEVGSHSLSAVFSSDTNFSASTSGVLTQSVIDFTTTPGGSGSGASQMVTPGSAATYSLAILPTSGASFPAPALLTITGMPTGATATVSPLSWTQTSGTSWNYPANTSLTNVVLTIQLPSATARTDGKVPFRRDLPPVLWGLLLFPFAGRLRRKLGRLGQTMSLLLLLAAGCAVVAGLSGCGSSNGFFNQPQQTYTMNVTVSSGALSHSSTITLTVE
jgi:Bacterial Ig-like domain (group 3)/MBG domain (YGX type)